MAGAGAAVNAITINVLYHLQIQQSAFDIGCGCALLLCAVANEEGEKATGKSSNKILIL